MSQFYFGALDTHASPPTPTNHYNFAEDLTNFTLATLLVIIAF